MSIYFLAKTCPPSFNWIFRTADNRSILFLPACLSTQGVYKKVNDSWPPCSCTALSAAELWIFKTIYLKFNKPDFALIFTIRFIFKYFTRFGYEKFHRSLYRILWSKNRVNLIRTWLKMMKLQFFFVKYGKTTPFAKPYDKLTPCKNKKYLF